MFLADSNIIIYSYLQGNEYLREILYADFVFVSEISRVEVLGYHKIKFDEELYFKDFFSILPIIQPTPQIFEKATQIRRSYNLGLGDAIIASTALVNDLTIYTRNIKDFGKIEQLQSVNPIM